MKLRGFWVSLTEPDEKKQDVCQTRAVRDKCLQLEFHKIAPRMSVPEFERGAWGNLADEWIAWEAWARVECYYAGGDSIARRWGVCALPAPGHPVLASFATAPGPQDPPQPPFEKWDRAPFCRPFSLPFSRNGHQRSLPF